MIGSLETFSDSVFELTVPTDTFVPILSRIAATLGISVSDFYLPTALEEQRTIDPATRKATIAELRVLVAQQVEPKSLILELLTVLEAYDDGAAHSRQKTSPTS